MTAPPAPTHTEDLLHIARQVVYESDTSYRWQGKTHKAPRAPGQAGDEAAYPPVVERVAKRIYDKHYTRRDHPVGGVRPGLFDRNLQREFIRTLHAANATRSAWTHGWRVVERRDGQLVVQHLEAGARRTVPPESYEETAEGEGVGRVRRARGNWTRQPAWYHASGEIDHFVGTGGVTVRVYWNVSQEGAIPLLRTLTAELNAAGIPFHYKTLSDPQQYGRADSAVLYMPQSAWEDAAPLVASIRAAVGPYLNPATPLFTLPLAGGIGAAEDPGIAGESFGMHRSRLVAEALWRAFDTGLHDPSEAVYTVRERFREEGLDPDAPHLNAGSRRTYALTRPRTANPTGLRNVEVMARAG